MHTMVLALLMLGVVLLGHGTRVEATTIVYTATDVNDALGPGGDLWEYRYTVSGRTFLTDVGFSITFRLGMYSDLDAPAVNSAWDVVTFQPDSALSADGFYDALALVDGASLADTFTVRFIWHDTSGMAPGSQPFTVYALDTQGLLHELEHGNTTAPGATVPEPGSLALLSLRLVGLGIARYHGRSRASLCCTTRSSTEDTFAPSAHSRGHTAPAPSHVMLRRSTSTGHGV